MPGVVRDLVYPMSLKETLKSWVKGPPPAPPDPNIPPRYPGETLVEVIYSKKGRFRVVITQEAKTFRVHDQEWEAPAAGSASWVPADTWATFTDSLERAQGLAQEHLRERGNG